MNIKTEERREEIKVEDDKGEKKMITNELDFTELGLAKSFAEEHKNLIGYVPFIKQWLIWNGKHWDYIHEGIVLEKVENFIENKIRYLEKNDGNSQNLKKLIKFTKYSKINNIIKLAESKLFIDLNLLNARDNHINLKTKTFNLANNTVAQQKPEDFLLSSFSVDYDPSAQCPEFKKFMKRITEGNEDYQNYLQKATGYFLAGDNSEQCFFLIYGTGNNAKTTYIELLKLIFENYISVFPSDFIADKNKSLLEKEFKNFIRSKLVVFNEFKQDQTLKSDFLKLLTGGDTMSANLSGGYYEFKNKAKLIIISNHKPIVKDHTKAFWKRVQVLPFVAEITEEEKDKYLLEKLSYELPGIFNWILEGYNKWKIEGLNPPETVVDANKTYKEERDHISLFLDELCDTTDVLAQISSEELFRAYSKWCKARTQEAFKHNTFIKNLVERGFQRTRITASSRGLKGIKLYSNYNEIIKEG